MAAAFCHEAATRAQGAIDTFDHSVGTLDPVKHSVAEDSVELLQIRWFFAIDHVSFEAEPPGCLDLRRTRIHTDHLTRDRRASL
jgi:hypothetical protein